MMDYLANSTDCDLKNAFLEYSLKYKEILEYVDSEIISEDEEIVKQKYFSIFGLLNVSSYRDTYEKAKRILFHLTEQFIEKHIYPHFSL